MNKLIPLFLLILLLAGCNMLNEKDRSSESTSESTDILFTEYENNITYQDLVETPEQYLNKKITTSGKVVLINEGSSYSQVKITFNNSETDFFYGKILQKDIQSQKLKVGDSIIVYGTFLGIYVFPNEKVPSFDVDSFTIS